MPLLQLSDVPSAWRIQNRLLQSANRRPLRFDVTGRKPADDYDLEAIFYLHGLWDSHTDCQEINMPIESRTRLIRLECFGVGRSVLLRLGNLTVTFRDLITCIHNTARAVSALADLLGLTRYGVVAHSWGGLCATVVALQDPRCKKAMLLCTSPDFCSVLANIASQVGWLAKLPFLGFRRVREESYKAQRGESAHQAAFEVINPWREPIRPDGDMLFFCRDEDHVMPKESVERYVSYCCQRGITGIKAEFVTAPELRDRHGMPFHLFGERMQQHFGL